MVRYTLTILITLLLGSTEGRAEDGKYTETILRLEESLARKGDYERAKEERIGQLRNRLEQSHQSFAQYQQAIQLYEEYKSYKYDSAHHYALRSLALAEKLGKADYVVEAKCAVTFCLLSAGLYKEADDEFESIDVSQASEAYCKKYYWMASRMQYDMSDYNHSMPYIDEYVKQGGIYTDSLLRYLEPKSAEWLYAEAMRQMKEFHYDESTLSFKQLLKADDIDTHTKAIATSCLGWISFFEDRREEAMTYLAEAAIYDNETATKETTALCSLAGLLYEDGDIERATRYVQLSLDDANFYDARQRKIEIGRILPIIEQDRYNIVKSQRNTMITALVAAALAILILGISIYVIRRQMRKLQQARQLIEARNNDLLKTNQQLHEANKIKNEYIGKSFYINAEYINKVEKLYKMVDRKIAARQFDDLRAQLKESTLLSERKNMCAGFDETFLKLFPDFVEKYNELFEEKDRRQPDDEKSLTSEMRIFALIRLGVSDSERIANFLDYSVHTVNTYKTRVKNRSIVENEQFEQRIMEI